MRRYFLIMGALVLMLAMVAACGDDDDDDDTDVTDDVTVTVSDTDDEATEDDADVTATADDGEATGTEADADVTGTESDGAAGTMDADATGTDDDDDADDGTETDDDDAAGTETDDDAAGTEDDDMDDATATEVDDDDDADATGTDDDSADATAGEDDSDDDAGFGDPVIIGDFILTVSDVMELDSGGVVAPDEGNKFLGVEMTVENTGTDSIGLSQALLMTRLEDDDGEQYEVDLAATAIAIFSGGYDPATEIGPGTEITGVAGFQVPEDVSPDDLTLVIMLDAGEQVEIPLGGDDDTP